MRTPGPQGGPFVIRPESGAGLERRVTLSEIKKYNTPAYLRTPGTLQAPAHHPEPTMLEKPEVTTYLEWHIISPPPAKSRIPVGKVSQPVRASPLKPVASPKVRHRVSAQPAETVGLRRSQRATKGKRREWFL